MDWYDNDVRYPAPGTSSKCSVRRQPGRGYRKMLVLDMLVVHRASREIVYYNVVEEGWRGDGLGTRLMVPRNAGTDGDTD